MNFSISEGIGFLGGWILFGAVGIAFIIALMLVIRLVRGGGDDTPAGSTERMPDDDVI